MKVLISADMEGTCGVVSWTRVMPPEVVGSSEPSSQDRSFAWIPENGRKFIRAFRAVMACAGIRMAP